MLRWLRPTPGPRIWSLDLETTGLHRHRARVLAVGMVPVEHGAVLVGEAYSSLVGPAHRPAGPPLVGAVAPSGGSATPAPLLGFEAHHLRPVDVAGAPPLPEILDEVLARLRSADALLVHHAPLDVTVLRRACEETGRTWPDLLVIDTLRRIRRANTRSSLIGGCPLPTDLQGARAAVGLPPHTDHDPLADAIATAELHLALTARGV